MKICDFGSATKLGEELHGSAEFRYSFGRVSREWKATFGYDLFCMGALFYEIIVGEPPFKELNRAEVVERFKQKDLPALDAIEHAYAIIIENCWNDKYSSFQELQADIPPQVDV
jgi:serine/threonine protein kinase